MPVLKAKFGAANANLIVSPHFSAQQRYAFRYQPACCMQMTLESRDLAPIHLQLPCEMNNLWKLGTAALVEYFPLPFPKDCEPPRLELHPKVLGEKLEKLAGLMLKMTPLLTTAAS
jgi:hypothetical protein